MPVYAPSTTSAADAVTAPLFSSDYHHCHTPYAAAFSSQQQLCAMQQMPSMAAYHSLYHQQQQQMFSSGGVNMVVPSSSVAVQGNNVVGAPQQQMMVMPSIGGHARVGSSNNNTNTNNNGGRSSRSPNNANGHTNSNGNNNATSGRQPSVPFNPAAAMPLEDMISAYNNVKAREIEMQANYANEVAAAAATATATGLPVVAIPPFVSPFVDYACSQQGKLVLQGLLHFEDEVAVAQDLFTSIGGSIEHIALNEHGCHVIRALGEKIGVAAAVLENEDGTINTEAAAAQNEASLIAFISSLHETLFLNICTLSQESRRIPQALFETYNGTRPELFTALIEIVARNVLYLSATQQGCIALIRIYEACNFAQKRQIAANLVRIIADLSCDSFGNYVVQCLIEHSEIHVAAQYISSSFVGQCVRLSCNKFASNVLEKAIKKLSHIPSVRKIILDELIFDQANVTLCCEDSFANFVVQTIIETCSNAAEFRKVYDRVKGAIGNSMYAVKIEARLRSKSFFTSSTTNNSPSSNPAVMPSMATGGAMQQIISVSVGNAALQQHNNNNNKLNNSSSVNTSGSGIPSPLNATMIGLASTNSSSAAAPRPIYNATTAPSTPMLAASSIDEQQATFSSADETANRSSRTVSASAFIRGGADGAATFSTTSPKVQQQQQRFNSKFSSRGSVVVATTGAFNNENEAATSSTYKSNAHSAASPMNTKEKEDTLRAEAKRLLNSDKPPARFTPYKPSPFQQNRNTNVSTNVSTVAASTSISTSTPAPATVAPPSSSPLGLKERTANSINVEKNVSVNHHTGGKKSHNNNKPHKDRNNTNNKNNGSSLAAAADANTNNTSQSSSANSSPSPARHQNGHGGKNKNFSKSDNKDKDTNKSPRAGSNSNTNNYSAPRRNGGSKTRASHTNTEVACHH